jgi:hypothetical protein
MPIKHFMYLYCRACIKHAFLGMKKIDDAVLQASGFLHRLRLRLRLRLKFT